MTDQPGNSVLRSVVLAAGFASLNNISGLGQLNNVAQKHYGRALNSISTLLTCGQASDELVASVAVIPFYEIISGCTHSPFYPHEAGLLSLLRKRGDNQCGNSIGSDLYRRALRNRQINMLGSHLNFHLDPKPDNEGFDQAGDELWALLRESTTNCNTLRELMSESIQSQLSSDINDAFGKVVTTLSRLGNWKRCLPRRWQYRSCAIPGVSNREDVTQTTYPDRVYLFRDVMLGGRWIAFWSAQIHVLKTIINCVKLFPHLQDDSAHHHHHQDFEENLREIVDDICASVPFMMDSVDQTGLPRVSGTGKALGAFFLLRALYVANLIENLRDEQRRCIMKSLLRIAHVRGIKLALMPRMRWVAQHGAIAEDV
ncbi:hypothetical protein F5Y16DRAFT_403667 [Xylariaceae sp. FL0255]|nr:hypothetical protein F5Y16DRAFT_403667 [Xylariaceae sp. FL0255]